MAACASEGAAVMLSDAHWGPIQGAKHTHDAPSLLHTPLRLQSASVTHVARDLAAKAAARAGAAVANLASSFWSWGKGEPEPAVGGAPGAKAGGGEGSELATEAAAMASSWASELSAAAWDDADSAETSDFSTDKKKKTRDTSIQKKVTG